MAKEGFLKSPGAQNPAMIYLEHLYSEYATLKSEKQIEIAAVDDEFIENLYEKREKTLPKWNDLYRFELILANHLPVEKLRGKVVRLRYDFRSVAGQKEFDDYMASKPPDLQSPPDPTDPPDRNINDDAAAAGHINYEKLLREDLKDLLDRLYMRYAILPVKEKKLTRLTWFAAGLCLFALISLLLVAVYLYTCPEGLGECGKKNIDTLAGSIASLTILVVVVAGMMGGFVSALQRIQSQPVEGDSIYNLSLLFYGSYSVFVAPVTGGIFAILLYLMFTSEILSGSFFPKIYTPPELVSEAASRSASSDKSGESPNTKTNTNANLPNAGSPPNAINTNLPAPNVNTNMANSSPGNTNTGTVNTNGNTNISSASANVAAEVDKKAAPEAGNKVKIVDFLGQSGPKSGKDYSLLILWCFIAGFAERFVPDVLDRFISRNGSSGGNKS